MFEADETDDLFTPSLTEISEVPSPPPSLLLPLLMSLLYNPPAARAQRAG